MSWTSVFLLFAASCSLSDGGSSGHTLNNVKESLKVNEAALCLRNHYNASVTISLVYNNCYRCRETYLITNSPGTEGCSSIVTDHGFKLSVVNITGSVLNENCTTGNLPSHVEPKGVVNVTVHQSGDCKAEVIEGEWQYWPLIGLACILVTVGIVWNIGLIVYRKIPLSVRADRLHFQTDNTEQAKRADVRLQKQDVSDPQHVPSNINFSSEEQRQLLPSVAATQQRRRLRSLDTFRGLSLVIMIFVNYGGGGYWFFKHSKWNGLTVADLVFPWFVFILGTSAAISLSSLDRRGMSRWRMLLKVIRRFVILFGLGLLLNKTNVLPTYRIPGVLQRLATSYLGIALLHILFAPKRDKNTTNIFAPVREIINHWIEWIIALSLIIIWLLVTFLLRVPHCPTGYLYPAGKLGDYGNYSNHSCTGGAAGYIDRLIFSDDHIYPTPECVHLYMTGPYDPEGALGTLTSIFLAFLGQNAGRILLVHRGDKQRMYRWIIWGIFWGAIGTALCEGRQNGGLIPINKSLWSLSFIAVMAGTGYILLALLYFIIDVKKLWMGEPFVFPGMNSILVYMGHEVFHHYFPFSWNAPQKQLDMLAQSSSGALLWVIIAYYMYFIDFFVKI